MSGTPTDQFLRSTVVAGDIHELGASGTTASILTKATYPNAGTGSRRFIPELSSSAGMSPVAVDSPPSNVGWRQTLDISPDPVQFAAGTWTVNLNIQVDTAAVTGNFTVVIYVGGVERGRTVTGAAVIPQALTATAVAVTIAGFTTTANPRIQVEAYANVTVGGVNLNGVNISLQTGGTVTRISGITSFSVRAARTTSDTVAAIADTTRRVLVAVRGPTEVLSDEVDTTQRVSAYVRSSTDVLAAQVDTVRRVAAVVRRATEILADEVDTAIRVYAGSRRVSDVVADDVDTAIRVGSFVRRSTEVVGLTDATTRQASFPRSASEVVAGIVDTASRVAVFRRTTTEVLADEVDTTSTPASTHGRSARPRA